MRTIGGQEPSTTLDDPLDSAERPESDRDPESARRGFTPTSLHRGRALFAAVTLGALTAATAGQSLLPRAHHQSNLASGQPQDVAVVISTGSNDKALEVQPADRPVDAAAQVAQLSTTQRMTNEPGSGATTTAAIVKPADGAIVSSFGGSYGTFHYGIEIAGSRDAPIFAVADGTIIAAGPTSGFGMWVKEQLADGTILVYARMNDFSVQVGQQVSAGQQIARMGDRGFATGYTLHFEVWNTSGKKIDPEEWLNQHGVIL